MFLIMDDLIFKILLFNIGAYFNDIDQIYLEVYFERIIREVGGLMGFEL